MLPNHIDHLIIGAGPAGLAVAGRMREQGLSFELVDQAPNVGSSWRNHYDRLHLHTVKELSNLPHLPFPSDYPRFVPRKLFVQYLDLYAKHFGLEPYLNKEVQKVNRKEEKWEVTINDQIITANNVIMATGINRVPNIPTWKGQEEFQGKIIHSRDYKNATPFLNQKVLVIGIGNTGAELALDLAEHSIDVSIAIRSSISIVPREINGRPTQLTGKMLEKLPFGIGDWLGAQVQKIIVGDLSKYGIERSKKPPAKMLKETGKTPVIDIGTVEMIKKGAIKVINNLSHFFEKGVVLKDSARLDFDAVVLATGYKPQITDLLENTDNLLDRFDVPKQVIGKNEYKGLFFVGFDNYKLGGILGTINTDSKKIVDYLKQQT